MSKEETIQLKGIAILMMLYLHLFCHLEEVEQCTAYIPFINGKPLAYAAFRIGALCVPVYLFLSGYGFSKIYEKTGGKGMHLLKRVFSLYANYWIIFLLFIPAGCLIAPDKYPGSAQAFVLNFIGWESSYNGEWWFLFPYILLVLSSGVLLPLLYRWKEKASCFLAIGLFAAFAWCHSQTWENHFALIASRYLTLVSMFVPGVLFARFRVLERCKESLQKLSPAQARFLPAACLGMLLFIRMAMGSSGIINPPFALLFILCYTCMRHHIPTHKVLSFLGKHSTNMWLIHTFFAYYLFHDFIYGFRYPPLIYLVLIICSLACSIMVQVLYTPIKRLIRT